jgi:hypothetical protein
MSSNKVTYRIDVKGNATEQYRKLNREQGKFNKSLGGSATKGKKAFGGISISAMAAVAAVTALGVAAYKTIKVFEEFQKTKAILSNTFGSKFIAEKEFKRLQEFASKTPFQVDKLSKSFTKLINRGFNPTNKQLRQLGDLASTTGKDFDQLAEALLDAETGEFERLKEFGIKASKEGDKVKLSFKGITKEVDNTSAAIRTAIADLGDMEGVAGSMKVQMNISEGLKSQAEDALTELMNTVGSKLAPISDAIYIAFTKGVAKATDAIKGDDDPKEILLDPQKRYSELARLRKQHLGDPNDYAKREAYDTELKKFKTDFKEIFEVLNLQTGKYKHLVGGKKQVTDYVKDRNQLYESKKAYENATKTREVSQTQRRDWREWKDAESVTSQIAKDAAFFLEYGYRPNDFTEDTFIKSINKQRKLEKDAKKRYEQQKSKNTAEITAPDVSGKLGGEKTGGEIDASITPSTPTTKAAATKATTIGTAQNLKNAAPKTFNINVETLMRIDEQNNMTGEDVDEFQEKLVNVLLSAVSSVSAQSSTF